MYIQIVDMVGTVTCGELTVAGAGVGLALPQSGWLARLVNLSVVNLI